MERGKTQQEKKPQTQTNKGRKTFTPSNSKGKSNTILPLWAYKLDKKRQVRHPYNLISDMHLAWIYTHVSDMKYHSSFRLTPQTAFTYVYQPWFKYVRVSSYNFTAGDVAAHITYWKGGCLVSFSCGRLESSCLKIGSAKTSLKRIKTDNFETSGPVLIEVKEKKL